MRMPREERDGEKSRRGGRVVTGGMGAGWVGTRSGEKCLSSSCAPAAGASERRSVHPGPSRARPRVAGPAGPGMLGPPALAVAVGGSRSRTRPAAHSHADFCNAWRGESQVAVCAVSRIRNGLVFFFLRGGTASCVSVCRSCLANRRWADRGPGRRYKQKWA